MKEQGKKAARKAYAEDLKRFTQTKGFLPEPVTHSVGKTAIAVYALL